ncbi:prepilin-type N-terminal cleavage/methylation domain-containing protein, partial [bacterium]|nr:prepilin-type N-terminal cleavage/methylation domain-containing protein [bacterium]
MFFKKKRNSGFTLVEIIISLAIISTILLVAIQMFVPTNLSSAYLAENLKINLLLNTKYA